MSSKGFYIASLCRRAWYKHVPEANWRFVGCCLCCTQLDRQIELGIYVLCQHVPKTKTLGLLYLCLRSISPVVIVVAPLFLMSRALIYLQYPTIAHSGTNY